MESDLIEQVKQHEILYNSSLPNYKESSLRSEAWEEIGIKLNMKALDVKKSWHKLRRCYVNALNRRLTQHQRVRKSKAVWKYDKRMSFILPFIEKRNTRTQSQQRNKLLDLSHHSTNVLKTELLNSNEASMGNDENSTNCYDPSYIEEKLNLESNEGSTRSCSPDNATSSHADGFFRNWNIESFDDTDMFFMSMSKIAKRLPPIEQARIKLMLSNAVLQAQIRICEGEEIKCDD